MSILANTLLQTTNPSKRSFNFLISARHIPRNKNKNRKMKVFIFVQKQKLKENRESIGAAITEPVSSFSDSTYTYNQHKYTHTLCNWILSNWIIMRMWQLRNSYFVSNEQSFCWIFILHTISESIVFDSVRWSSQQGQSTNFMLQSSSILCSQA